MKSKNKKIVKGVVALSMLSLVGGSIAVANAASNNSNNSSSLFGGHLGRGQEQKTPLTDQQKTEMQTKLEAVKSALESSDYNAWATAMKAINENSPELSRVTSDNFADYVQKFKDREAKQTERQTQMDAVKSALDSSDYNAWVAAVTAMNSNSPLLSKITADNFSQYVQVFQLHQQADSIMKNLGIENQGRGEFGMGMGGMMRGDRGFGHMMDFGEND